MTAIRVPVRNQLSRLMNQRGWTDGTLAARAGMARVRVNRIKNGRARPTVREALLLAAAFALPVASVFHLDTSADCTAYEA